MLWSDCGYAQADLRLYWSHISHCWKSHVAAQIFGLFQYQIVIWSEYNVSFMKIVACPILQTLWTQIRLLSWEQSDQGSYCLLTIETGVQMGICSRSKKQRTISQPKILAKLGLSRYLEWSGFWLIELRLKVPVNNISIISGFLPKRGREKRRMDRLKAQNLFASSEEANFILSTCQIWQGHFWLETEGPRVRASPASLHCCPWARHIYPSLVLVQPRKISPA